MSQHDSQPKHKASLGTRLLSTIVMLAGIAMMIVSAWWAYESFMSGQLKAASMCLMGVFAGFFAFVWAWDFRQASEDDLFDSFYGVGGKSSLGGKTPSGKASARYYPNTHTKETERYKK